MSQRSVFPFLLPLFFLIVLLPLLFSSQHYQNTEHYTVFLSEGNASVVNAAPGHAGYPANVTVVSTVAVTMNVSERQCQPQSSTRGCHNVTVGSPISGTHFTAFFPGSDHDYNLYLWFTNASGRGTANVTVSWEGGN